MKKVGWLTGGLGWLGLLSVFGTLAGADPTVAHPGQAIEDAALAPPEQPSTPAPSPNDAAAPDETVQQPATPIPVPTPGLAAPSANETIIIDDPMAQMRSVAELSDVQPSDWGYQALSDLYSRYIISGYPDGKFRGNQPMSRNEFAAAMAQVFDAVVIQLRTAPFNQIVEDYRTLRQLQAAYGDITRDLQQRFDRLTTATAALEQQQFSTTTQLNAQVVAGITDGTNANGTLIDRVRLNLKTSFSGRDLLMTQFEAGNNGRDAIAQAQDRGENLLGTDGVLANGGGLDYVGAEGQPRIRSLYYSFQPAPTVNITVGAKLAPGDFIDNNRFANQSLTNFSSSFFMHNPLIIQNDIDRTSGAGVVVNWQPLPPLTVRGLYVAADANQPDDGLFGDRYQASVEAQYDFNRSITARLQYTHAKVNGTNVSAGGINAEWAINSKFAVFGRLGFGRYKGKNAALDREIDFRPWSWQLGLIARQLIIPGSTAGVAIGQPFVEKELGEATQTNIEAFYRFLLNDNVSFSPALIVVTNPDNQKSDTIWQVVVQMVFSF